MYDKTIKKDGGGYKVLISTVIKYNVKVECEKLKIYIDIYRYIYIYETNPKAITSQSIKGVC